MAEVWEGFDVDWETIPGDWELKREELKRIEFCADHEGVRVRLVTVHGVAYELTTPGAVIELPGKQREVLKGHKVSWDDWKRLVSRIDYEKYGR